MALQLFSASRRIRQLALVCSLGLALTTSPGRSDPAAEIAVIGHPSLTVTHLSREEVAALFLGKRRTVADDRVVIPLDSDDSVLRERFYEGVAGMTPIRFKAYWSRIVFSGQGRPPPMVSADEALAWVATDPRALAYIRGEKIRPGMKVLLTLP